MRYLALVVSLAACSPAATDNQGDLVGSLPSSSGKADGIESWQLRDNGEVLTLSGVGESGSRIVLRFRGGDTNPETLDNFEFTLATPASGSIYAGEDGTLDGTINEIPESTVRALLALYTDAQSSGDGDDSGKFDTAVAGPVACDPSQVILSALGTGAAVAIVTYACVQTGLVGCVAGAALPTTFFGSAWGAIFGIQLADAYSKYRSCTRLAAEFANSPKTKLMGVLEVGGVAVEKYRIYLYSDETGWVGPSKTDALGRFSFANIPDAMTYQLRVFRPTEREYMWQQAVNVHGPATLTVALPSS